MVSALVAGEHATCRQIALDLFLAEHSISVICDDVFAAAFRQIGELWSCGEAEVYQEERLRDRPFANTLWELGLNLKNEQVNEDINVNSISDIRLYVFYEDFTQL